MRANIGDVVQIKTDDRWDGSILEIIQIDGSSYRGIAVSGNPLVKELTDFRYASLPFVEKEIIRILTPTANYGEED